MWQIIPALLGAVYLDILNKNSVVRPLTPPVGLVSINLPALNEEEFIDGTLNSIYNNNVVAAYPERFEIIVVDNGSSDETSLIAHRYAGTKVIHVPRKGLLYARDAAIRASQGEIIVSVNADTIYPPNWLNNILWYFNDPEVVAVAGMPLYLDDVGGMNFFLRFLRVISPQMHGQASAFRKQAWVDTGGFRIEETNQQNLHGMIDEEQYGFMSRLVTQGKFVNDYSPVWHIARRYNCPVCGDDNCDGKYESGFCREVRMGIRF